MTVDPLSDHYEQCFRDMGERIDHHGYTAMVVGTGECSVPGCVCAPDPYPYAYSLGFCEREHPELVTFGLPLPAVNAVMDPVRDALRLGTPLAIGREHRHQLDHGPVISLVEVPDLWVRRDPGRIGMWIGMYGHPLPDFVQICWADRNERLPWDDDCDPGVAAAQPLLADDPLRYPKPPRNRDRHRRHRG